MPGRRPNDDGPSAPQAQRSHHLRLAPDAEAKPTAFTTVSNVDLFFYFRLREKQMFK